VFFLHAQNTYTMNDVTFTKTIVIDKQGKAITGLFTRISKINGTKYVNNYKNGKLNGISKSFDKNGNLLMINYYKNDKSDGITKMYDKNSILRVYNENINGMKNGLTIIFEDLETYFITFKNNTPVSGYVQNLSGEKFALTKKQLNSFK